MGASVGPFASELIGVLGTALEDEEEEVCHNAAYGLGVVVAAGGPASAPLVPRVLSLLYDGCVARRGGSRGGRGLVTDNAIAAVARILMAAPDAVREAHESFFYYRLEQGVDTPHCDVL